MAEQNATISTQLATDDFRLTVMRNVSACAEVNLKAVPAIGTDWYGEDPAKWGATNLERDSDSLIIQG